MSKDHKLGKLSLSQAARATSPLSTKKEKLIKILDSTQIKNNITIIQITNTLKDREEIARAFIAKPVYNMQTIRDFIGRLKID